MTPHLFPCTHCYTSICCAGAPYSRDQDFAVFLVCAQGEIIAQGGPLPKCDIVDTTFHALAATRQIGARQGVLPTT